MTDYISRDALGIGFCNPAVFEDNGYAKGWNAAIKIIKNAPAADVREVKRGCNVRAEYSSLFECSVCGWSDDDTMTGDTQSYNFCPNCGADMREEQT